MAKAMAEALANAFAKAVAKAVANAMAKAIAKALALWVFCKELVRVAISSAYKEAPSLQSQMAISCVFPGQGAAREGQV